MYIEHDFAQAELSALQQFLSDFGRKQGRRSVIRGDGGVHTRGISQHLLSVGAACQSDHQAGYESVARANCVFDGHFRSRAMRLRMLLSMNSLTARLSRGRAYRQPSIRDRPGPAMPSGNSRSILASE